VYSISKFIECGERPPKSGDFGRIKDI
jgi:hypothetical protein